MPDMFVGGGYVLKFPVALLHVMKSGRGKKTFGIAAEDISAFIVGEKAD